MPLTGSQIKRIQDAILAAFDRDELRRVVRIGLEEWLEVLVPAEKPYRSQVFELISWADRYGRVADLLRCLHEDRPNDATLSALYDEAKTGRAPDGATPPAASPAPTGPHQIFLSYSHKDAGIKARLLADLHGAGFSAWTDDGLEPGTPEWQRAIKQAIVACQCLVVILSPDAEQSEWVNIEITYAKNLGRRVFPVLAHGDAGNAMPISLINTQYVDVRTDFANQVEARLLPALHKYLGSDAPAEVRALIARMEDTSLPAVDRLEAGLRATDRADLPPRVAQPLPRRRGGERLLVITVRRSGNLERDKYRLKEVFERVRDPRGRDRFVIRIVNNGQAADLTFPNDLCTISEVLAKELVMHFKVEVAVHDGV